MLKTILLTLFLGFISIFSFAQNTKAEFPGGNAAFQNEFLRMVHAYVDTQSYGVDGKFTFIVKIGTNGKMSDLKILPRIKNDKNFVQDMEFAMNRIKKKWKPAKKDGKPIESSHIFEINFTTDFADHGD